LSGDDQRDDVGVCQTFHGAGDQLERILLLRVEKYFVDLGRCLRPPLAAA
jgi:hypothetical protein